MGDIAVGEEKGTTYHDIIDASFSCRCERVEPDAAIDLDGGGEVVAVYEFAQLADLAVDWGMYFWPPNPGLTVITNTVSINSTTS